MRRKMLPVLIITLLALVAGTVALLWFGAYRWDAGTQELRAWLDAGASRWRGGMASPSRRNALLARPHH